MCQLCVLCKADIRNPLSLLAHERSCFATCQWELLTPTDISIPLPHRLVLYALEAGGMLILRSTHDPYFSESDLSNPDSAKCNTYSRRIFQIPDNLLPDPPV